MSARDSDAGSAPSSEARIDGADLVNALRRVGVELTTAPTSVCPAAERDLHFTTNGELTACEFGRQTFGPAASWRTVRDDPAFASLRAALRAGSLESPHCAQCRAAVEAAPLHRSPLVLGIAHSDEQGDQAPVVTVSSDDETSAEQLESVAAAAATCGRFIVIAGAPLDERWAHTFAALPAEVEVVLRVETARALETAPFEGLRFGQLVVELTDADPQFIAAAEEFAGRHDATLHCRFHLTASRWHLVESAGRSCLTRGHAFSAHTTLRPGIEALSVGQLDLIQATLTACSRHAQEHPCEPAHDHTASLATTLSDVAEEVRERLLAVAAREVETDEESPADEGFQLPTADHDWVAASEWWRPLIWARSHTDQVARWVEQELERSSEQWLSVDWLRCLTHKIAWERHSVGALNALRQAYGTSACAELLERDAAFATAEQLGSYGGPWYTQLGLDHPTRTAPFATTGATEPPAELEPAQVTVLIPSYKHERFIADTIHSVLRQTTGAFRLLVVDDRSPDGTVDAARAIEDPRLEVRVNERNLGLGNSVVEALRTIDTPYVALLNSDDLFHPERLQRCLEVLDADPQAQIVTTSLHLIDDRNGELTPDNVSMALDGLQVFNWVHWYEDANVTGELSPDALFKELLQRNFLATSSNLTARTDWLRSKAEAFQNLKYCLDWQIFLDAALEGSLRHLDQPLVGYRLHASNTVWFDDGGRWAFYLEVSRVITEAVRHYAARRGELDEPLALDIVTATADHIALNREADGLALFLNSVLDSLTLDRIAAESAPVQELLRKMRQRAAERLALADHEVDERQLRRLELRTLIATCERDRLRGEKAALRERLDANEARITRLRGELDQERGRREQMAANLAQLRARQAATEQRVADLREDSKQAQRRAEERIAALRDHEHGLRQRIQRMEEARTQLRARVAELEQRAVELRERLDERRQQLKTAQENFAAARSKLRSRDEELARQTEARNAAEAAAHERALELEAERAKSAAATAEQARLQAESEQLRSEHAEAMERLDKRRAETVRQLTTTRAQLDEVSNSREFRTGNFIWNKLPFGYMSRRGKKWYNRILDVRDRFSMWASGKVRKPRAEGCAVVAATWQWPIYSHTFVYQEMLALTQMGLEVRLFHWKANDFKEMQPAFAPLKESRVEMRPSLPQHRNDRDYWDKQLPGKLDKLLERVGQLVGRTVEDLREDPHVLRACTFARNAEHVGATYLHSYFFYDQSFMVMVTSWLLDLPRGVSCYADHMMDDYPFKLVALQIELASVVVATSARIKQELVDIAGAEHADKIIVKPNGVNGERFPAIDRGERKPDEPFEVISISRLEPKKGLEYMIDAVAELKKRGRKIKVHIIGAVDTSIQASIDYGVELEQQIAQLGLGDEVILHGMMMHEQIQPIMQRCRAFVAPYVELESGDKDGIPTAMLEALASGLPVVTTDSGSILEVVQDGVQALVTPQRDSAAYAEALDKLITDPAFERKLAEAARKRFDQEFDIKVTERRLHERVAAALQQKAAAAR